VPQKKNLEKEDFASFSHFFISNKWLSGKNFTSKKNVGPKGHGQFQTRLVRWARQLRPSFHWG